MITLDNNTFGNNWRLQGCSELRNFIDNRANSFQIKTNVFGDHPNKYYYYNDGWKFTSIEGDNVISINDFLDYFNSQENNKIEDYSYLILILKRLNIK